MTIDKAIDIITNLRRKYLYTFNQDLINALGLGIEALREVDRLRETGSEHPYSYLLGETGYKNET